MIEEIKTAAKHLNGTTDAMVAGVQAIEEALRESGVGVRAAITMPDGQMLGYMKVGKLFRLSIKSGDDSDFVPWSDCKREVKIAAIQSLPLLIEVIHKKIATETSKAEQANAILSQCLKDLGA